MEREVGGGIGMGNTCKPMALSFQCMTKSTTKKNNNTDFRENIRCILIKMCACVCVCVCAHSCLTLCNLMNCSPPDSSVHGILQARTLE